MQCRMMKLDHGKIWYPIVYEQIERGYVEFPNDWGVSSRNVVKLGDLFDINNIRLLWPTTGNNGWLATDGKFYTAPYSAHIMTAVFIQQFVRPFTMPAAKTGSGSWQYFVDDQLTRMGWIHCDAHECTGKQITQPQLDWLFDNHKSAFRAWTEKELRSGTEY